MFSYDERMAGLLFDCCRRRLLVDPSVGFGVGVAPGPGALAGLLCEQGNDPERVLGVFLGECVPSMVPADSSGYLAFIGQAPTPAARLFDMFVSAGSMGASHWFESAGAVCAENQVLRLLADVAGFSSRAGGCFVSGGSAGNLSALVVAREHAAQRRGGFLARPRVAVGSEAHASVALALKVIGVDALVVGSDDHRLTGANLAAALARDEQRENVIAVVATAGSTNGGVIDDLDGIAAVAKANGLWFHVDGAYGAGALFVPELRGRFLGIEHADSLVVDPHKWLFAPYDCGAVLYAEPEHAKAALSQEASYLETLTSGDGWNPCDYAFHLTRRARGLALWFSLAVHGINAYRDAIAATIQTARACAELISQLPGLELVRRPELSVVLFRRDGWAMADYSAWAGRLLSEQIAFVAPTSWEGAPTARLAFMHPNTSMQRVRALLDAMQ
jgi:glutamate/tyrosine decarboxylase-like PLP-dependent enzyme